MSGRWEDDDDDDDVRVHARGRDIQIYNPVKRRRRRAISPSQKYEGERRALDREREREGGKKSIAAETHCAPPSDTNRAGRAECSSGKRKYLEEKKEANERNTIANQISMIATSELCTYEVFASVSRFR